MEIINLRVLKHNRRLIVYVKEEDQNRFFKIFQIRYNNQTQNKDRSESKAKTKAEGEEHGEE